MSYHTAGQVMEPDPPVLRVERTTSESLHLTWEAPKDDGGGEIYLFVIEIAAWDCAYEPARNGFFEDFREWTVCHTGPAKVLQTTLENLVCDNPYRLRAKASNEAGDSPWTDVTLTRTAPGKKGLKKEAAVVPRSWLAADLPDIMAQQQQLDAEAGEPTQFVRLIGDAFKPWVFELRRVFKFYVTAGAGNASRTEMSPVQFLRFCKDCGLAKGEDGIRRRSAPTAQQLAAQQAEAAGEAPPQVQAVQLSSGEVSLMFQRANMENLQSRSKSWKTAQALAQSAQQAAGTVAAEAADDDSEGNEDSDVEDDTKDSGAKDAMAIKEWIGALSRLAWACLPEKSMHIGERLNLLLTAYIIPAGRAVALKADLEETLTSRRVVSLMEYFAEDLAPIFKATPPPTRQAPRRRRRSTRSTSRSSSSCSRPTYSTTTSPSPRWAPSSRRSTLVGRSRAATRYRARLRRIRAGGRPHLQRQDPPEMREPSESLCSRCSAGSSSSLSPSSSSSSRTSNAASAPRRSDVGRRGESRSRKSTVLTRTRPRSRRAMMNKSA